MEAGRPLNFLVQTAHWFADPAHWHGKAGIAHRVVEHVGLSALAVAAAALVAIPAGVVLGHARRAELVSSTIVNLGRALPSFAIVALALPLSIRLGLGFGFWPTWLAVFALAVPPMFTNSYTAVRSIEPDVVEAARGMGMAEREVIRRVEVPLGAPLMLAATRITAVQVVATVPLGALVGWGGLGRFIIDGLATYDFVRVFAGALLVAALAVVTDVGFGVVERIVLPAGVRRLSRAESVVPVG